MNHLEFLNDNNRSRFYLIDDNSNGVKFLRSLKELDQLHGRDVFKIGVLYIGAGQSTAAEFLKNENGSEVYNQFVSGLGWNVDLKTHNGFMGGLDRNLSNGKASIYYRFL